MTVCTLGMDASQTHGWADNGLIKKGEGVLSETLFEKTASKCSHSNCCN